MSDTPDDNPDFEPPDPEFDTAEDRAHRVQFLDMGRTLLRGCVSGISKAGILPPSILISAYGYIFNDLIAEYLMLAAKKTGRRGYEAARSFCLNLLQLLREDVDAKIKAIEAEMLKEDFERVGGKPDERVN